MPNTRQGIGQENDFETDDPNVKIPGRDWKGSRNSGEVACRSIAQELCPRRVDATIARCCIKPTALLSATLTWKQNHRPGSPDSSSDYIVDRLHDCTLRMNLDVVEFLGRKSLLPNWRFDDYDEQSRRLSWEISMHEVSDVPPRRTNEDLADPLWSGFRWQH
ncbi:hypothetical protein BC938DRAFT_483548 [Jimgerdemannia flammicorona]|uniref:Uncharacterized protein n=1 Tax=Jimgerdemannia flammicorona TaxID=994334 RepID=A0A433QBX7_9FUNG|nr:hypothetical protein BC938DRAFT_483548 [Jimgerdemannia flammicorona]